MKATFQVLQFVFVISGYVAAWCAFDWRPAALILATTLAATFCIAVEKRLK